MGGSDLNEKVGQFYLTINIVMMNGTITTKKDFVETIKAAMEAIYSDVAFYIV